MQSQARSNLKPQRLGDDPAEAGWASCARAVLCLGALFLVSLVVWALVLTEGGLARSSPVMGAVGGAMLLVGPLLALAALLAANPFKALRNFRAHPDGEARHVLGRVGVATLLLGAASAWLLSGGGADAALAAVGAGIGLGVAWLLLAGFILFPPRDRVRKAVGLVAEIGLLSLLLHIGDRAGAPWFFLYPCMIAGYGFSYGLLGLLAAATAGAAGFAAVAATTPVWRDNWPISAGLFAGLIVLPAFAYGSILRVTALRRRAETASQAKDRLFSALNQELKTPLHAIMGLVDMIRDAPPGSEAAMLDTIAAGAKGLLGMVDDLAGFTPDETGAASDGIIAFDLPALLIEIAAVAQPDSSRKGVTIGCQIDPLLPDGVAGRPAELRRLLIALIGAAVQAVDRGEVRLSAVLASANGPDIAVRFEVRDSAKGRIPDAVRKAFQSGDGDPAAIGGSGFGLVRVRDLAKAIGGKIALGVQTDGGSVFTLDLPLAVAGQRLPRSVAAANVGIFSTDAGLVQSFQHLPVLDRMGVVFAALGEIPFGGVPSPVNFDLLIFDGRLDPAGALAAAARTGQSTIRTLAAGPAPAIMVITAVGMLAHAREMAAASVDTVLGWTDDETILVRAVSRLLRPAGARARPPISQPQAAIADPAPLAMPAATPAAIPQEPESVPPPSAQSVAEERFVNPADMIAEPESPRRLRVLIAEDNQTNRMVLQRIFTRNGHDVVLACDGAEALSALDEGRIDAAIVDLKMPELTGFHVVKLYRQMESSGERLPLIGLTADPTTETERQCREAGMDGVLIKPVDPGTMIETVLRLVAAAPPRRPQPTIVVTPISAHPRFGRETTPIVDVDTLNALADLGDESFFRDVIAAFLEDAEQILPALEAAQAGQDLRDFHDQLLALRSSGVNVGAARLCQTVRDLAKISADELQGNVGTGAIAKIRGEVLALKAELGKYRSQRRPAE